MKLPDLPIIPLFMDHGVRKELNDFTRKIQREAALFALEEAARVCENGRFLHDDASAARFARECAKALRALKGEIE